MASSTPTLDSIAHELSELELADDSEIIAEDQAEDEASQEDTVLYAESDVPQIIESLYSQDEDEHQKGIEALTSITTNQPELITPHIPNLTPSILKIIPTLSDESRRSALIDLLSQVCSQSTVASELLHEDQALEAIVPMLRQSDTLDKYSWVNLLEEALERAAEAGDEDAFGKFEGTLVELLQGMFYSPGPSTDKDEEVTETESPTKAALNAIEVFELTLVLMKAYLRSASLKAGAIEFLVLVSAAPDPSSPDSSSSPITSTEVRLAAISCIAEVYSRVVDDDLTASDVPYLELGADQKLRLQGFILIPILDLVGDKDGSVSDKAVEVLYGRINDDNRAVTQFFSAYDGSLERLIHKLASSGNGAEGDGGAQGQHPLTEWLLSVLINRNKDGVKEAFSSFWASDAVENSTKRKLVTLLPGVLSNIQEVAGSAGVSLESAGPLE